MKAHCYSITLQTECFGHTAAVSSLTWPNNCVQKACVLCEDTDIVPSSLDQFMNQSRQAMAMKMEGGPGANPAMRPGMQPGMGGQVGERDTHPFNTLTGFYDLMTDINKQ